MEELFMAGNDGELSFVESNGNIVIEQGCQSFCPSVSSDSSNVIYASPSLTDQSVYAVHSATPQTLDNSTHQIQTFNQVTYPADHVVTQQPSNTQFLHGKQFQSVGQSQEKYSVVQEVVHPREATTQRFVQIVPHQSQLQVQNVIQVPLYSQVVLPNSSQQQQQLVIREHQPQMVLQGGQPQMVLNDHQSHQIVLNDSQTRLVLNDQNQLVMQDQQPQLIVKSCEQAQAAPSEANSHPVANDPSLQGAVSKKEHQVQPLQQSLETAQSVPQDPIIQASSNDSLTQSSLASPIHYRYIQKVRNINDDTIKMNNVEIAAQSSHVSTSSWNHSTTTVNSHNATSSASSCTQRSPVFPSQRVVNFVRAKDHPSSVGRVGNAPDGLCFPVVKQKALGNPPSRQRGRSRGSKSQPGGRGKGSGSSKKKIGVRPPSSPPKSVVVNQIDQLSSDEKFEIVKNLPGNTFNCQPLPPPPHQRSSHLPIIKEDVVGEAPSKPNSQVPQSDMEPSAKKVCFGSSAVDQGVFQTVTLKSGGGEPTFDSSHHPVYVTAGDNKVERRVDVGGIQNATGKIATSPNKLVVLSGGRIAIIQQSTTSRPYVTASSSGLLQKGTQISTAVTTSAAAPNGGSNSKSGLVRLSSTVDNHHAQQLVYIKGSLSCDSAKPVKGELASFQPELDLKSSSEAEEKGVLTSQGFHPAGKTLQGGPREKSREDLILCLHCGIMTEGRAFCLSCKRPIRKTYGRSNSVSKNLSPATTISSSSEGSQTTPALSADRDASELSEDTKANKQELVAKVLSNNRFSIVERKLPAPQRGRGRGRGGRGRGKSYDEPVILTLSSDEEDDGNSKVSEDGGSSSSSASTTGGNSLASAAGDSEGPWRPPHSFPLNKKEPIITQDMDQERSVNSGSVAVVMAGRYLNNSMSTCLSLKCRSVRFGSYKVSPSEPVVIKQQDCVTISVPPLAEDGVTGPGTITLTIPFRSIVRILGHFGNVLPVVFLYLSPSSGVLIRNALRMEEKKPGMPYFDPGSKDESHRRITILPDKFEEESRRILKDLLNVQLVSAATAESKKLLHELSQSEANDILIRSSPQEVQSFLRMSGVKVNFEAKTLFVYPPPPVKGGITVTSDDFCCLEEEQFLNDVILDFYLKWLMLNKVSSEDRERTHVFSTFFYKRLTSKPKRGRRPPTSEDDPQLTPAQKRHARVKSWTKNVDLFSKDFILIPINEHSHWFLAAICFPGLDGPVSMSDGKPVPRIRRSSKKVVEKPKEAVLVQAPPVDDVEWSDRDEAEGDDDELEEDETTADDASKNSIAAPANAASLHVPVVAPLPPDGAAAVPPSGGASGSRKAKASSDEKSDGSLGKEEESESTSASPSSSSSSSAAATEEKRSNKASSAPLQRASTSASEESQKAVKVDKDTKIKQPCILIFDSLSGASRSRIVATLRDYLTVEHEARRGTPKLFSRDTMPGACPKVPQQMNFSDCGVFTLQFAQNFFERPPCNFRLPIRTLMNWFHQDEVGRKREAIAALIKSIMHEQKPNQPIPLPMLHFNSLGGKSPCKSLSVTEAADCDATKKPLADTENLCQDAASSTTLVTVNNVPFKKININLSCIPSAGKKDSKLLDTAVNAARLKEKIFDPLPPPPFRKNALHPSSSSSSSPSSVALSSLSSSTPSLGPSFYNSSIGRSVSSADAMQDTILLHPSSSSVIEASSVGQSLGESDSLAAGEASASLTPPPSAKQSKRKGNGFEIRDEDTSEVLLIFNPPNEATECKSSSTRPKSTLSTTQLVSRGPHDHVTKVAFSNPSSSSLTFCHEAERAAQTSNSSFTASSHSKPTVRNTTVKADHPRPNVPSQFANLPGIAFIQNKGNSAPMNSAFKTKIQTSSLTTQTASECAPVGDDSKVTGSASNAQDQGAEKGGENLGSFMSTSHVSVTYAGRLCNNSDLKNFQYVNSHSVTYKSHQQSTPPTTLSRVLSSSSVSFLTQSRNPKLASLLKSSVQRTQNSLDQLIDSSLEGSDVAGKLFANKCTTLAQNAPSSSSSPLVSSQSACGSHQLDFQVDSNCSDVFLPVMNTTECDNIVGSNQPSKLAPSPTSVNNANHLDHSLVGPAGARSTDTLCPSPVIDSSNSAFKIRELKPSIGCHSTDHSLNSSYDIFEDARPTRFEAAPLAPSQSSSTSTTTLTKTVNDLSQSAIPKFSDIYFGTPHRHPNSPNSYSSTCGTSTPVYFPSSGVPSDSPSGSAAFSNSACSSSSPSLPSPLQSLVSEVTSNLPQAVPVQVSRTTSRGRVVNTPRKYRDMEQNVFHPPRKKEKTSGAGRGSKVVNR